MDSFHGVDAEPKAEITALPHTSFPTIDEVERHVREAQRLRAEVMAAGLSAAFGPLLRPFRPIGSAIGRWHERSLAREMLMRRSDRLLADIGTDRENIDVFLRGKPSESRVAEPTSNFWRDLLARVEAIRQARQARKQVENELMAYKDNELDEMGIRRADIPKIAWGMHPTPA